MRKVCVVVTARPSYSRVRSALLALQQRKDVELQLIVAASALLDRYGSVVKEMEADGFQPAARVFMLLEGENLATMAKTTGIGLIELATALDNLKPDVVVTIADRYETIATAIAGSYMNIPVAHIQGGEVTGSIDEKVRHAVTKLSDLHLVSTERARERVIKMGELPERVHVTGCPSIDIAKHVVESAAALPPFDPMRRYGGVGATLDLSNGYLVVLFHPVTTEYETSRVDASTLLEAVNDIGLPTLWFWPNPDAGSDGTSGAIRTFREMRQPKQLHLFKNFSPDDFLRLLLGAKCLVGNSSVGIRESSYLGTPVVNVGSRQQGRDRGANVRDVACEREAIRSAIRDQVAHGRYPRDELYGDGDAGGKIAALLATVPLTAEKRLAYDDK